MKGVDLVGFHKILQTMSIPDESNELLELIEYLYMGNEIEEASNLHKKLYTVAENRFSGI